MKKYKKIPTNDLGLVAYYLLQVTQGIFKWNGELFFCPFVTVSDKKHPLRASTWSKVFMKDKKHSLAFIDKKIKTLYLFADPVDPVTYIRTRHHAMDMSLGVDEKTIVYKGPSLLIIKNGKTFHRLEFVKKISDDERLQIFDPDDSQEHRFRVRIWQSSKKGSGNSSAGYSQNEWIAKYHEFKSKKSNPTVREVSFLASQVASQFFDPRNPRFLD